MEADADKPSLSTVERLLYWFVIPIVFTAVLGGALLSLFDYDIKNQLLTIGHKVPGLAAIVPDPKVNMKQASNKNSGTDKSDELKSSVDNLKKQLEEKEQELKTADTAYQQKDQAFKDIQEKNTAMEEQLRTQGTKSPSEYDNLVQQTAAMYAKMLPSKAAPIIENLTLREQVLVLSQMKMDEQVKILEKMDPKIAAKASIYLKDSVSAKDRQLDAMQERLQRNDTENDKKVTDLNKQITDLNKQVADLKDQLKKK